MKYYGDGTYSTNCIVEAAEPEVATEEHTMYER